MPSGRWLLKFSPVLAICAKWSWFKYPICPSGSGVQRGKEAVIKPGLKHGVHGEQEIQSELKFVASFPCGINWNLIDLKLDRLNDWPGIFFMVFSLFYSLSLCQMPCNKLFLISVTGCYKVVKYGRVAVKKEGLIGQSNVKEKAKIICCACGNKTIWVSAQVCLQRAYLKFVNRIIPWGKAMQKALFPVQGTEKQSSSPRHAELWCLCSNLRKKCFYRKWRLRIAHRCDLTNIFILWTVCTKQTR